jgi:hypothetical protein
MRRRPPQRGQCRTSKAITRLSSAAQAGQGGRVGPAGAGHPPPRTAPTAARPERRRPPPGGARSAPARRPRARGRRNTQQVGPGGGHEHAQLFGQLQRIQQQVRGPVRRRVRELVEELAPPELSDRRSRASGGRKRWRQRCSRPARACAGKATLACREKPSWRAQRSLWASATAAAERRRRTGCPAGAAGPLAYWDPTAIPRGCRCTVREFRAPATNERAG